MGLILHIYSSCFVVSGVCRNWNMRKKHGKPCVKRESRSIKKWKCKSLSQVLSCSYTVYCQYCILSVLYTVNTVCCQYCILSILYAVSTVHCQYCMLSVLYTVNTVHCQYNYFFNLIESLLSNSEHTHSPVCCVTFLSICCLMDNC